MSLEVLRQVKRANDKAREDDQVEQAELGRLSPETPSSPLPGAWGGQLDTTLGSPGSR